MQNRTRRLWGQEIDVVQGGLSEEQVVSFASGLVQRYRDLAARQEHFLSLGSLSERAAHEAERVAEESKTRAKEESSEEAYKMIFQARQRAEEMLAVARKTAQEVTRAEADNILEAARRKAGMIETEAKQQSQLFLMKARSAIDDALRQERNEALDQLIASVRTLLFEAHDIEVRWKGRMCGMCRMEGLELGETEIVPFVLAAEIAKASAPDIVEDTSPVAVSPSELADKKEEVLLEASAALGATGQVADGNATETPLPSFDEAMAWVEDLAAGQRAAQRPVGGENEEGAGSAVGTDSPGDVSPVFEHRVDVHLTAPVELSTASRIYAELHANPEIEILQTVGSYDKGTTITVFLKKPVSVLVDALSAVPGAEVMAQEVESPSLIGRIAGRRSNGDSARLTIPVKTHAW